ncbi:hypothetical protein IQ273_27250 [Nodosilinea sp. LEGE 07298]|uniref:hypothetical protein n=1 Tax=Nodosilinea sp. LEGE 07298 TaxID=2777970 RepID=UPI00187E40B0|nr:hypothetical protein [Nodosilinea sp. LEGE 07298]MBE9113085.1 hypothetical protein [Nodosilinea sp. LEGE 07298]
MFEYLDPDASGASNLPPSSHRTPHPRPERVRHMIYGSLAAIDRTIKILHALGYADPNDWGDPIPAPPSAAETRSSSGAEMPASSGAETPASSGAETWMAILTKTVLIE